MAASAIADWVLLAGLVVWTLLDRLFHLQLWGSGVLRSAQIDAADLLVVRLERLKVAVSLA